jgi:hypothetical protein
MTCQSWITWIACWLRFLNSTLQNQLAPAHHRCSISHCPTTPSHFSYTSCIVLITTVPSAPAPALMSPAYLITAFPAAVSSCYHRHLSLFSSQHASVSSCCHHHIFSLFPCISIASASYKDEDDSPSSLPTHPSSLFLLLKARTYYVCETVGSHYMNVTLWPIHKNDNTWDRSQWWWWRWDTQSSVWDGWNGWARMTPDDRGTTPTITMMPRYNHIKHGNADGDD